MTATLKHEKLNSKQVGNVIRALVKSGDIRIKSSGRQEKKVVFRAYADNHAREMLELFSVEAPEMGWRESHAHNSMDAIEYPYRINLVMLSKALGGLDAMHDALSDAKEMGCDEREQRRGNGRG